MWRQHILQLTARKRGLHLITDELISQVPDIADYQVGLLHLFLCHTSAALTLNENADPSVRVDMQRWLNHTVADNTAYFTHTYEGPDDMSAHIKSSLFGASLTVPITVSKLAMGTWQGIYLCEFREHGGTRRLIATLQGELR
ncbi:secondary thiamine-phosphate synthase enzyme YjbQ [Pseudobowmanella zhangzhouensis]|uniref:secondary thiamine-phosphate synthase enzyme YjbQ n=1 Tax=Pseudobowmanella zhangzhouensis TaxID=1537679 RepID=UPI0036220E59